MASLQVNLSTGEVGMAGGGGYFSSNVAVSGVQIADANGDLTNITANTIFASNLNVTGDFVKVTQSAGAAGSQPALTINQETSGDILQLQRSGAAKVTVLENGNLGIGTAAPQSALHVIGSATLSSNLVVSGNITATGLLTASNLRVLGDYVILDTISSNTEQMVITNDGTGPALKVTQTGANSIAEFYDDGNALAFKVANDGLIGIGTATPQAKLHVVGSVKATSSISSDTQFLGQAADTASAPSFSFAANPNTGLFQPAASNLAVSTGGTERMRVLANGNVGIGTTNPLEAIHVNGKVLCKYDILSSHAETNYGTTTSYPTPTILKLGYKTTSVSNFNGSVYTSAADIQIKAQGLNWVIGEEAQPKGGEIFIQGARSALGAFGENASGGVIIRTFGSTQAQGYDRLIVTGAGNVGIGTTNPLAKVHINDTGAMIIPSGTTTQQPGTPYAGMLRLNTTTNRLEYYNILGWQTLALANFLADILVVGGGGSGSASHGAGGGGGGFVLRLNYVVYSSSSYNITVGTGGANSGNSSSIGNDGNDSTFGTIIAGGGGGGGIGYNSSTTSGRAGRATNGNGGGAGGGNQPGTGGSGNGEGFNGGNSVSSSGAGAGGGGGGAGAVGANASGSGAGSATGGVGGVGRTYLGTYYAGGGGGGGWATIGANGGLGGGGKGGNSNGSGIAGTANTGGGGGGSGDGGGGYGAAGGSGIIIITTSSYALFSTGLVVTTTTTNGLNTYKITSGTGTMTFT